MEKRKLGRTNLETAPVIFGGNIFGWTVDEGKSFELLDAFTDKGFNTIDTADVYSRWVPGNKGGESELIIGNWVKKKNNRKQVIIATKAGADFGNGPDLSAKNIIASAEASLKRLQTDYIDLYQSHFDDGTTPVDETLEAYAQLVAAGKVLYIGTSNMTPLRITQSLDASRTRSLPRYETLQPQYNLYDREKFEQEYQQLAKDNELGVIPYYSLASGFLTGKYRSEADLGKSQRGGGIKKYLGEKGRRILKALDEVSEARSATPAQVSLAWLVAQPTITAAIASATSIQQLDDFSKAAALVLTVDELEKLTKAGN
ncbi:MAG: aldo/keto reductase [Chitinophagaceae bacterium]|nr:MAG: aldo/keto reductase [Chitinophagaceae bacterium]